MPSAPSLLTPAPQIRRVSRRHCALYKLNLLTYLLTLVYTARNGPGKRLLNCLSPGRNSVLQEPRVKRLANAEVLQLSKLTQVYYLITSNS